jgi:hypothetical protein
MGDAGEGLIDADSRIQERMEELERQRAETRTHEVRNPQEVQAMESLRLARVELQRQLESTAHERRRAQLTQAIADIDRRMADLRARLG